MLLILIKEVRRVPSSRMTSINGVLSPLKMASLYLYGTELTNGMAIERVKRAVYLG